jgi:hypothetical protein
MYRYTEVPEKRCSSDSRPSKDAGQRTTSEQSLARLTKAMIPTSLSRRQFIGRSSGATLGSVALVLMQEAGGASDPTGGRGLTPVGDEQPKATLHWDEGPDNATGLLFEWGEDGVSFPNVVPIAANLTSAVIGFPRPGTYYGRLKAYNDAGTSPPGQVLVIPVKS